MSLEVRNALALLEILNRKKTKARRSKHSVGKTRIALAKMIGEQLHCHIDPEKIWRNSTPWAARMDLARWGCDALRSDGRTVNIHSWDRMGSIVKSGKICVVGKDDGFDLEVCSGE